MKKVGMLVALAISPVIYAGEILTQQDVEVMAVNGKEVKSSFFSDHKIEVEDGKHQVVVRYSKNFKNDSLVESRPYIFEIDVQGDTTISTDRFTRKSQAQSNIKKGLTWSIENKQGTQTISHAEQLQGKGFMPYSNIESLIASYNQQNNISIATTEVATPTNSEKSTALPETSNTNPIIEQYKLASKEQRKAFKIWLIDNETK